MNIRIDFHRLPMSHKAAIMGKLLETLQEPATVRLLAGLMAESAKKVEYMDMVGELASGPIYIPIYGQAEVYPGKRQFGKLVKLGFIAFKPGGIPGKKAVLVRWKQIESIVGDVNVAAPVLGTGYGMKAAI